MQLLVGCCKTLTQGDITPEIVHHALPIPAMLGNKQELAWWRKYSLLSCLDLDKSNYFGIRKSRISVFIADRQQISRPSRSIQCHYYPSSNSFEPRLVFTLWNCNRDDTELFAVGVGTSQFGSRSITGRSQILTQQILLLLLQVELTMPTHAASFFSEVTCWNRAAKKGRFTLTVAHIFPHWSMSTLHNNVGQWSGPAPSPPPSEHKKSLCFPSSPIVRQNLFCF